MQKNIKGLILKRTYSAKFHSFTWREIKSEIISLVLIKTLFKSYQFSEAVWPPEKEVTKRIVKIDTMIKCNIHVHCI